jgi:hypothetical protein
VCAYIHTYIRNVCGGGSLQEREPHRDRQREIEEEESKTAIQSLNVRITVIIDKQ